MANNKNKKLHIALHEVMIGKLEEMAQNYGMQVPEVIRKCITDYYDKIYVKSQVGFDGAKRLNPIQKTAMIDQVTAFEAMSDEEATQFLLNLPGFYSEDELEDKTFTITRDEHGARIRRMRYKNGSGGYDAPFNEVMVEYKKFIRNNK